MERLSIRTPFLLLSLGALMLLFTACASSRPAEGDDEANDAQEEEMVDVGYGQQRKGDVTGSVSTVDVEEARNARPTARVSDLLRGRVSGVVVTETPGGISVRIRGANSIYGSSDPLYVVDDIPVMADPGGALSFINPHDIQSISVLKDASATAIYGSRGANGVIVIKTKRGRN